MVHKDAPYNQWHLRFVEIWSPLITGDRICYHHELPGCVWGGGSVWTPAEPARVGGAGTILGALFSRPLLCPRNLALTFFSADFSLQQLLIYGCSAELIEFRINAGSTEGMRNPRNEIKRKRESSPGPFQGNQVKFLEGRQRQLAVLSPVCGAQLLGRVKRRGAGSTSPGPSPPPSLLSAVTALIPLPDHISQRRLCTATVTNISHLHLSGSKPQRFHPPSCFVSLMGFSSLGTLVDRASTIWGVPSCPLTSDIYPFH